MKNSTELSNDKLQEGVSPSLATRSIYPCVEKIETETNLTVVYNMRFTDAVLV